MEPADHELMARVGRGDRPAFHLLARRHTARALGLARRIVRNEAIAEEIVQEAWLRVWTHAPRWRPAAQFRTWLYRIVVNLCLNERRRPPTVPLAAAVEPADPALDAGAEQELREGEARVAAAIDALPPRQRAAIVLTFREDLGNAETAAILDTSVSGVEALLVRAKRSLRAALADT